MTLTSSTNKSTNNPWHEVSIEIHKILPLDIPNHEYKRQGTVTTVPLNSTDKLIRALCSHVKWE